MQYRNRTNGSVSEQSLSKYLTNDGPRSLSKMGFNCYVQTLCPQIQLVPAHLSHTSSNIQRTKNSASINPFAGRSKTCKWVSGLLIAELVIVLALLIWGLDVVTNLPPGGSIILPLYIYPNATSWQPLYDV
jgi:hypothetical protein